MEIHVHLLKREVGGEAKPPSLPFQSSHRTPQAVFRALRATAGRCIGRIYLEDAEGVFCPGWIFQRKNSFSGRKIETWATLLQPSAEPKVRGPDGLLWPFDFIRLPNLPKAG